MTIYKIKYLLDMDEDYYLFLADAIDAGNHYIDKVAQEEHWDETMISHAKDCLKNYYEFNDVVRIKEIEARASRNSANW